MAIEAMLPGVVEPSDGSLRWLRPLGCVQRRDDGVCEVYVGGVLIGAYEGPAERNVLLVKLSEEPRTRVVELAAAFDVSTEVVRRARRAYESGGITAITTVRRPGAPSKATPELRRRVWESFARGRNATATAKALHKHVSYGTVWRLHQEWRAEQASSEAPVTEVSQRSLDLDGAASEVVRDPDATPAVEGSSEAAESQSNVPSAGAGVAITQPEQVPARDACALTTALGGSDGEMTIGEAVEQGGHHVQHAGAWIAVAILHAMGVYRHAARLSESAVSPVSLRIALDAVVIALAIGERCVEGVRRLETPSASTLLRAEQAVSASWAREVLHRFADVGATSFHLAVACDLMREGFGSAGRVAFYVDNHLRRYTGKHTVRKGWKMQDRRAVPGCTDYYLHDVDGQPLMRVDVPSHDSLPRWLSPIATVCRRMLGKESRVLLSFDRGGAFAHEMAALRDQDFEFVTYERAPYPLLASTAFEHKVELTIDGKVETIQWAEGALKNLRAGRGRVRRISLRMADDRQINLLAISGLSAEALIGIQLHRWRQENAFKHGVERWGINQLDGRKVEPTPADDVIPNPARSLLDHRLRFARAEEGRARNKLARLPPDDPSRTKYEQDLERAVATQAQIEEQRPHVPRRAPVKDTSLAGKLVRHVGSYKTTIDTLRVALANAESELAARLAPSLPRPAEAKKTLANLFAAPGRVRVTPRAIYIDLAPAASPAERDALHQFLRQLDALDLTLPGDPEQRRLRFRAQHF
jgi:transposase